MAEGRPKGELAKRANQSHPFRQYTSLRLISGYRAQRLIEIPEYVVERFEPDGDAQHVGRHTSGKLLFLAELPMRCRGRGCIMSRIEPSP